MISSNVASRRGAALLIVLLLVATLSVIVLAMSSRVAISAERSIGLRARGEALWFALGAEQLATSMLVAASQQTDGVMSREDPWVERPIVLPVEGARITAFFSDSTRCFNLNSLVSRNDENELRKNEEAAAEFLRLLAELPRAGVSSEALVGSIIDWMDSNPSTEGFGAEDDSYLSAPTPYRTGGALMSDVSELLAVRDMTPEHYAILRRHVCALPSVDPTGVNLNMLTPEDAPVLAAMIGEGLTSAEAASIILGRPPGGWRTLDGFWNHPILQQNQRAAALRSRTALGSRYVEGRIDVARGDRTVNATMIFRVQTGRVQLVSRRLGPRE